MVVWNAVGSHQDGLKQKYKNNLFRGNKKGATGKGSPFLISVLDLFLNDHPVQHSTAGLHMYLVNAILETAQIKLGLQFIRNIGMIFH